VTPITPAAGDSGDGGGDPDAGDTLPRQVERFLRIRNQTGEGLTVWVQYRTRDENGNWSWLPADPRQSDDATEFQIPAAQTAFLSVHGERLHASRVRMWAMTDSGRTFTAFAESDLWLVPEVGPDGQHWYLGARMGTFSYTFSSNAADE
jgi:hypothetical protein